MSVVVVSWNVRALLVGCLNALLSPEVHGDLTIEVIVVDNNSHDGSAEAAESIHGVRVIREHENLGYGRAANKALEAARGDTLLVLNPDTEPQAHSLQALWNFMETYPQAGIVSPRLLNADGTVQEAAFRFPTLLMAALDLFPFPLFIPGRIRQGIYRSRLNGRYFRESGVIGPYRIDHPLGACMLLRREAYIEVGGFDPAIHMYAEEIDLALRYRAAGWECWQVPESRVVHFGGQSTAQVPDKMYVELWRSRLYLYSQHYSRPAAWSLRALLVAAQLYAALVALIGRLTGKTSRDDAKRVWKRAGALIGLALR